MYNLDEYNEIYNKHYEVIKLACDTIDSNPYSNVVQVIDELISFLGNQLDSLTDWADSAKTSFAESINACIKNLEAIKIDIDINWKEAEKLYKETLKLLVYLKFCYLILENQIKRMPNKESYIHHERDEYGNIISTTYPGYSAAYDEWKFKCDGFNNTCEQYCKDILLKISSLEQINGKNLSLIDISIPEFGVKIPVPEVSDISGYRTQPSSGFNDQGLVFQVTTGNQTYDLSDKDRNLLYAIVASEAAHNPDDALGVTSVILNRVESNENFLGGKNPTPISIATANNQFEGYFGGYYKRYLDSNGNYIGPAYIQQAVDDGLAGTRNTNATYFLANWCDYYSDNLITPDGNRYKMTWKA